MKTFKFILVISKPTVSEEVAANRLYARGCSDALFSVSNGEYLIEFDREALTKQDAVFSAVVAVNYSMIGSKVIGVRDGI